MEAEKGERRKNRKQDKDTAVCVSNVCDRICRSPVCDDPLYIVICTQHIDDIICSGISVIPGLGLGE